MPNEETVRNQLDYILPQQAMPEQTHNLALNKVDIQVHLKLVIIDLETPPELPANGQAWGVGPGAIGVWHDQDGKIAMYYNGWHFITPKEGFRAWDEANKKLMVYVGTYGVDGEWKDLSDYITIPPIPPAELGNARGFTFDWKQQDPHTLPPSFGNFSIVDSPPPPATPFINVSQVDLHGNNLDDMLDTIKQGYLMIRVKEHKQTVGVLYKITSVIKASHPDDTYYVIGIEQVLELDDGFPIVTSADPDDWIDCELTFIFATEHASTHISGGSDPIPPADITSNGLLKQLPNDSGKFLNGVGNWVDVNGAVAKFLETETAIRFEAATYASTDDAFERTIGYRFTVGPDYNLMVTDLMIGALSDLIVQQAFIFEEGADNAGEIQSANVIRISEEPKVDVGDLVCVQWEASGDVKKGSCLYMEITNISHITGTTYDITVSGGAGDSVPTTAGFNVHLYKMVAYHGGIQYTETPQLEPNWRARRAPIGWIFPHPVILEAGKSYMVCVFVPKNAVCQKSAFIVSRSSKYFTGAITLHSRQGAIAQNYGGRGYPDGAGALGHVNFHFQPIKV